MHVHEQSFKSEYSWIIIDFIIPTQWENLQEALVVCREIISDAHWHGFMKAFITLYGCVTAAGTVQIISRDF